MERIKDNILLHILYFAIATPVIIPTPTNATTPRQTLMSVCLRWHQIILSSPVLWNNAQFLPDSSVHHLRLLNFAQQWIHRTAGTPVTLKFDGNYASANQGSAPTETSQLMYGAGRLDFIQYIILPCANRITSLTCTVATNESIRAFFRIPAGSLYALEHLDVLFVNQYSDWISGFTSQELTTFSVFRGMGSLRALILHLLNGIHPLHLQVPWTQLNTLDLGTTAMPPAIFRTILKLSTFLTEGCFLIHFSKSSHNPVLPNTLIVPNLRVLYLMLLQPGNEPHMLKRLTLPNLVDLRLEQDDYQRGWTLDIYAPLLLRAKELQRLTLAVYKSRIPLVDAQSHRGLNHRKIPEAEMKRFLNAIPKVACLRLPLAININSFVIEDMALGHYTPLLKILELGTIDGAHVLSMVHRRNLIVEKPQNLCHLLAETSAAGATGRQTASCGWPTRTLSRLSLLVENDGPALALLESAVGEHRQCCSRLHIEITSCDSRLFYHPH